MRWLLDTIKGRVIVVLVLFLSASHVLGLWLYAKKSEEAATLLHDALLAEQIALIVKLAERLPSNERSAMLEALSSPAVRISLTSTDTVRWPLPEGTRAHAFEHLLAVFLDQKTQEGIRLAYSPGDNIEGLELLLMKVRSSQHAEWDHLPLRPLTEIHAIGAVSGEVALADGSWVRFSAPLLKVSPFSLLKLGIPLTIMILSILLIAVWVLHRLTQPLERFVAAAEQLGTNIYSPALPDNGPSEVRTAARTLNLMQERIQRLVDDRTAFAAAIAHDLGTPITRLHLRAHEIEEAAIRSRLLTDLDQMRRMITATLEFARLEFAAEPTQKIDLTSLVQTLCDDYADLGEDVAVEELEATTILAKPTSLRRALANLIDNAVKYGLRARLSLIITDSAACITILDDGTGIPPDMLNEAFKPFRRINQNSANSHADGTGLGLSIARSIITAMGGEITLSNAGQGGLVATVTLPLSIRETLGATAHAKSQRTGHT